MLRAKLWRVATVVLAWAAAGLLMAAYDELLRQALDVTVTGYSPTRALTMKTLGTAAGGLVAASLVVFLFKGPLREKPFSFIVVAESAVFGSVAILVTSWFGRIAPDARFASLDDTLTSPFTLKWILFAIVLGGMTSFALEVHDRIGQGAFLGFLLGRYHRARREISRCLRQATRRPHFADLL